MTQNTKKPRQLKAENCTIYTLGAFGASRLEVKTAWLQVVKHAQYSSAVELRFLRPRKRKHEGRTLADRDMYLIVLTGWGHPKPGDSLEAIESGSEGITASRTRHACFAPEWREEFEALINPYLAAHRDAVLADFRGHNAYNFLEGEEMEPLPDTPRSRAAFAREQRAQDNAHYGADTEDA